MSSENKIGDPGSYPFTRGPYKGMYSERLWTMRQYAGFATAAETNKRFKYLLENGQTGLSTAFDLPTQMGIDPDSPRAYGEVGRVGVSIAIQDDINQLFDGIDLGKASVSMTINATAAILLGMVVNCAREQGVAQASLSGTVQNDILKEFIARGCYSFPPKPSLRIAIDVIEYACRNMPKWNFISVSGYHMREAGCTAAQEIGFTVANGICYVENSLKRNLDVNEVGKRISFFFGVHNNFLEEVAKFRAVRRLWAKMMKERFAATDPRAMTLRFHAQTCGHTLTQQQPENNVVRVTLQALAAILGGCQSLHTNSMDEALALPTEKAVKLALRTQQIIGFETDISRVVDPFGGSGLIEDMTDRLESEAVAYMEKIDGMGGPVPAIEKEFYQNEIEKSALQYQREIETDKRKIVGINCHKEDGGTEVPTMKIDPQLEKERTESFLELKKKRARSVPLDGIRKAFDAGENVVPPIIEALRERATLGEICAQIASVTGWQK